MTDPRHICAVIPTYNNGGTVADVVRGVLRQGLPVLVVDDGSTDDTARAIVSPSPSTRMDSTTRKTFLPWWLRRGSGPS